MFVNHHQPCVNRCGASINRHPAWGYRMQEYHNQFCEKLTEEQREAARQNEARITAEYREKETGGMKEIIFNCDRCGNETTGHFDEHFTAGYYNVAGEDGWSRFANKGEERICDDCMHSDPRYRGVYS